MTAQGAQGADGARGAQGTDEQEAGAKQPDPWAPPADVPPAGTPSAGAQFAGAPPVAAPPAPALYPPYAPPPAPYGQAAPYGAWGVTPPPQWRAPVNGFAVAALVTGLTCFLWPLALAFGITGLVQIPSRHQRGKGMAVAGVLLSVFGLLVSLGMLGSSRSPGSALGAAHGQQAAADLRIGDCFDRAGSRVRLTACLSPHDGEVIGSATLHGSAFPDQAERQRQLGPLCSQLSNDYAMDDWAVADSVLVHYYYPLEDSWASGDRTATCFLTTADGKLTGSLRKDRTNTTTAQFSYLQAMDAIDQAASKRPSGHVADDPAAFREWAGTMAGVLETQTAALDAVTWDPGVKEAVAAHLAELRLRIPALRAAADPASVSELSLHLADSDQHRGYDQQKAVRKLLGLSTDDAWLHQTSGSDGAPRSV